MAWTVEASGDFKFWPGNLCLKSKFFRLDLNMFWLFEGGTCNFLDFDFVKVGGHMSQQAGNSLLSQI